MSDDNDLAGAASDAIDDAASHEQDHLPGTNYAKVKFNGMAWESVEVPDLKTEVAFIVRGMISGHGEEVMADGDIREVATVKVTSVEPYSD